MLVVSLVSQPFRQHARARYRKTIPSPLCLPRFGVEVLGPGRVVFRARRRKLCETKATTNIAFAQGAQTSNSTS